jgi:hypothetical protein
MKKVTLSFPSYNSLWLFKDQTKAINIRIEPKKNLISGLFQQQEVEMALQQYNANTVQQQPG